MTDRDHDARHQHIDQRTHASHIASLNDVLRKYPRHGRLAITAGVIGLGAGALPAILAAVASFDRFDDANDPYGEHDFGAFDHAGTRLCWKIDYYDRSMHYASPDPANPAVTTRVLTVMLAEEY